MITMKTASTTYYTIPKQINYETLLITICIMMLVLIILIIRIAIKYKHIKEVEYQDQERRHQEILNAIKQLDKSTP